MITFNMQGFEPIGIIKDIRPADWFEEEHRHDFVELVYTVRGSCTHYINGKQYQVSRGDMLFINYGETHSFKPEGELEYINFYVKPEFMSENLVNLNQGYNGDLTSRQAGSIGGQMVKKMIESYENSLQNGSAR